MIDHLSVKQNSLSLSLAWSISRDRKQLYRAMSFRFFANGASFSISVNSKRRVMNEKFNGIAPKLSTAVSPHFLMALFPLLTRMTKQKENEHAGFHVSRVRIRYLLSSWVETSSRARCRTSPADDNRLTEPVKILYSHLNSASILDVYTYIEGRRLFCSLQLSSFCSARRPPPRRVKSRGQKLSDFKAFPEIRSGRYVNSRSTKWRIFDGMQAGQWRMYELTSSRPEARRASRRCIAQKWYEKRTHYARCYYE